VVWFGEYLDPSLEQAAREAVLVNLEPPDNLSRFNEFHPGKAAEILPSLLDFPG